MMASVYEKLCRSHDLSQINFKEHLEEVIRIMHLSSGMKDRVCLRLDIEDVIFGLDDAIPLGLIINELFTNSMKQAFPGDRRGTISIRFRRGVGDSPHRLIYQDNGIGFPKGVDFGTTFTIEFFGYGSGGGRSTPKSDSPLNPSSMMSGRL